MSREKFGPGDPSQSVERPKISLAKRSGRSPEPAQKAPTLERRDQGYKSEPFITREEVERYARGEDKDRTIETAQSAESRKAGDSYGCASINGSKEQVSGFEGNEDFAFAVEFVTASGDRWIAAGVADGVSQSAWSPLGSRIASRVFLETSRQIAEQYCVPPPSDDAVRQEEFSKRFSEIFKDLWDAAIKDTLAILEEHEVKDGKKNYRVIPTNWDARLYNRLMNDSKRWGNSQKREWFQTTIAGVAMGPKGGFGLLRSDGVTRVEREMPKGKTPFVPKEISGAEDDKLTDKLGLDTLAQKVKIIAPNGAKKIRITLATDGVSKTEGNAMEAAKLNNRGDCRGYVEDLVSNHPHAQPGSSNDNMSVAFLEREF